MMHPEPADRPTLDFNSPPSGEKPVSTTVRSALALFGFLVLVGLLSVLDPAGLSAQQGQAPGGSLASQSMRPYAHVFWAYALGWALVLGWVVSLSRRWGRVEDDLQRRSGTE